LPLVLAYFNELSYDEIAGRWVWRGITCDIDFPSKQQLRQKLQKEKRSGLSGLNSHAPFTADGELTAAEASRWPNT